tara:strand:+ start:360 stop:896 length:537 start_codon:yes stop_codon:yes gene_type:complete
MALTKLNFSGSGLSSLPNGSVIQTVSANSLDKYTGADFDASFENVTGLTVNITPSSTSNKIYVFATLQASVSGVHITFRIARDGNAIVTPTAAGNRQLGMAHIYGSSSYNDHYNIESKVMQVLDTTHNSTSQLTYSVQGQNNANPNLQQIAVNSTYTDGDANYNARVISTITAMEIKG